MTVDAAWSEATKLFAAQQVDLPDLKSGFADEPLDPTELA